MKALTLKTPDAAWHLLFPLGGKEEVRRQTAKGTALMVQEFDEAWCTGLVRAHDEWMAQSAKLGAAPQPRPVSVDHVIMDAVEGKDTKIEPRRVGDLAALRFVSEPGEGTPAGVYGLIDWTDVYTPTDSGRPYLSPTTKPHCRMRDGHVIQGPMLFEVGVVSLPALDTIGSMDERLPWSALPLPPYVNPPGSESTARSYIDTPCDGVIRRNAQHVEDTMELELSPEMVAKIAAMVSEAEERAYKRACEYMEQRMVSAPTMPSEPAPSAPAEPAPESAEQRALRIEADLVSAEAERLVTERRLLARNVGEFATRRAAGSDVSDLLGDYGALAKPQGIAGSAVSEPTGKQSVRESQIMDEAAIKGGDILESFSTLRDDYTRRGFTIVAE